MFLPLSFLLAILLSCGGEDAPADTACPEGGQYPLIAVGIDGLVARSTDQGRCWDELDVTTGELSAVASDGQGRMVAVGAFGEVLRSSDGGLTWRSSTIDGQHSLTAVAADGHGQWFAAGDPGYGRVYRSTDDGDSWTQVHEGACWGGGNCKDLSVDAAGNVLMVAEFGQFSLSTDGGDTWEETYNHGHWNAVAHGTMGWIAAGEDRFYISQNAETWEAVFNVGSDPGILTDIAVREDGDEVLVVSTSGVNYNRDEYEAWYNGHQDDHFHEEIIGDGSHFWYGATHGGSAFVVVGHDGYSATKTLGFWEIEDSFSGRSARAVASAGVLPTGGAGHVGACILCEDFEDGDWLGWGDGGGGYTISVVPGEVVPGAEGAWALSLTGEGATAGIFHLLDDAAPGEVSFIVKPPPDQGFGPVFTLSQDEQTAVVVTFGGDAGTYQVSANGTVAGSYTADAWVAITLTAVDFTQGTFDIEVDGVQGADEVALAAAVTGFDRVDLGSANWSQSWWDDLRIVE